MTRVEPLDETGLSPAHLATDDPRQVPKNRQTSDVFCRAHGNCWSSSFVARVSGLIDTMYVLSNSLVSDRELTGPTRAVLDYVCRVL